MKLQPASQKEVARIATGTALCAVVMVAVFAALGAAGVTPFTYTVVVGAVGGSLVAVLNFALMCLTVQNVAGNTDAKQVRARVQASYNARLMLQGLWGVAALILPFIQPVAALLPLLFPRVVIYVLQATGHYKPEPAAASPGDPTDQPEVETEVEAIEESDQPAQAQPDPAPPAAPEAAPAPETQER